MQSQRFAGATMSDPPGASRSQPTSWCLQHQAFCPSVQELSRAPFASQVYGSMSASASQPKAACLQHQSCLTVAHSTGAPSWQSYLLWAHPRFSLAQHQARFSCVHDVCHSATRSLQSKSGAASAVVEARVAVVVVGTRSMQPLPSFLQHHLCLACDHSLRQWAASSSQSKARTFGAALAHVSPTLHRAHTSHCSTTSRCACAQMSSPCSAPFFTSQSTRSLQEAPTPLYVQIVSHSGQPTAECLQQ
mmetsp:Transcript_99988/g.280141  ORF Transcript_99988/g.280141 Transcript_99988/m.280141 type:complete len:247 (-) Transcript_99988:154-894(-)